MEWSGAGTHRWGWDHGDKWSRSTRSVFNEVGSSATMPVHVITYMLSPRICTRLHVLFTSLHSSAFLCVTEFVSTAPIFFISFGLPCQVDAAAPTTMIAYLLLSGVALGALRSVITHNPTSILMPYRRTVPGKVEFVFWCRRGSLR